MAYDPNLPVDDSLATAVEMRNQFAGLKALYDGLQAQVSALQAQLALTLAVNGNNFSWSWVGPNPQSWKLWKIPSSLNPTPDNFQSWRNLATDNNEVDGGTRTVSWEADSGFCYALCAYDDDNDVALAPASNVIAVP